MSISNTGRFSIGLRYQILKKDQTFENARAVFLECRKHNHPIPDDVMTIITERFEHDHAEFEERSIAYSNKTSSKRKDKQLLLSIALGNLTESLKHPSETTDNRSNTVLEKTYDDYRHEKKCDDSNGALRKQLERYLLEEMNPQNGSEEPEKRYYSEFEKAKLLKKLEIYLNHIESLI